MAFKIGLAGLCTSHPESWVPIIRDMTAKKIINADIAAVWDGAETRPPGFAKEFAQKFDIPKAVEKLEDMVNLVDGVIVHTANWDRHIAQAAPFIEADKSVFIDKPFAGNIADLNQILDWAKTGKRITGGSSNRFVYEVQDFLAKPEKERGKINTVFAGCAVDEYNYGIHTYSLVCGLLGPAIASVKYLHSSDQKQILIKWENGTNAVILNGPLGALQK